jgi:hypothetical protein
MGIGAAQSFRSSRTSSSIRVALIELMHRAQWKLSCDE